MEQHRGLEGGLIWKGAHWVQAGPGRMVLPEWGGSAGPPCRYLPLGVLPAGKPSLPSTHGGSPSLEGFQIPCCSNPRFMKSGFLCVGSRIHASPKFLGSSAEGRGGSLPWGMSWSRPGAVCSPRPACHRSGQPQRQHHRRRQEARNQRLPSVWLFLKRMGHSQLHTKAGTLF